MNNQDDISNSNTTPNEHSRISTRIGSVGIANRTMSTGSHPLYIAEQPQLNLHRAKSNPMCGSISVGEKLDRKFPMRIGLPPRNTQMLVDKVIQKNLSCIDKTGQTDNSAPEPITPSFGPPFPLTPPEEHSISPLESLLEKRSLSFLIPALDSFLSDTASMTSVESEEDEHLATDLVAEQAASDVLDFESIATFAVDQLVQTQQQTTASISVVHQPLPFPLPQIANNHPIIGTLFTTTLSMIRNDSRLTASSVRTLHVLAENLPQENVPTSPPVTPSYITRNTNQQGYFSIKPIFSSLSPQSSLAVPPGEAIISITERIIPPSAEFELSQFLSGNLDSGFNHRLNELSNGGLFVLVLPTHIGGNTFHQQYLSTILDPILRNMIVRYGLRSQLATDISNTVALKQLLSFEALQTKISQRLETVQLTFPGSSESQFKIIASRKGTINLPFTAWYSWWLGQERPRIMGLLNYHLNVHGQGRNAGVSRSSIMLELEAGMEKAGMQHEVEAGIELATFIIQRVS